MKSIAEIVARFSHVRLATPSDNAAILEFLRKQPMQTRDFSIGFDRGDDFFAFYHLSSNHFETFLFVNEDRSIGGLGTLLFQDLNLKGQTERVGYFCDLRVDAKASAITHIQWRDFYAELVGELRTLPDSKERCSFLYTSVFDTNEQAIRSLTKKLKKIRYLPFHAYQIQTLLIDPLAHLHPKLAAEIPKTAARLPTSPFAVDWQPGTETANDVAVTTKSGELLASCRPWRSDGIRQPVIGGMSRSLKNLGHALPLLGRPAIRENEALRQVFLTQLRFKADLSVIERERARAVLVRGVYRQAVRDRVHLVSWIESMPLQAEVPTLSKKTFMTNICFATSAKLYEVVSTEQTPRALEFSDLPIYFEGAIL